MQSLQKLLLPAVSFPRPFRAVELLLGESLLSTHDFFASNHIATTSKKGLQLQYWGAVTG
jgi:hypothetical protein